MSAEPGELPEEAQPPSASKEEANPLGGLETSSGPPIKLRGSDSSVIRRDGSSGRKTERDRSRTKSDGGSGGHRRGSRTKDIKDSRDSSRKRSRDSSERRHSGNQLPTIAAKEQPRRSWSPAARRQPPSRSPSFSMGAPPGTHPGRGRDRRMGPGMGPLPFAMRPGGSMSGNMGMGGPPPPFSGGGSGRGGRWGGPRGWGGGPPPRMRPFDLWEGPMGRGGRMGGRRPPPRPDTMHRTPTPARGHPFITANVPLNFEERQRLAAARASPPGERLTSPLCEDAWPRREQQEERRGGQQSGGAPSRASVRRRLPSHTAARSSSRHRDGHKDKPICRSPDRPTDRDRSSSPARPSTDPATKPSGDGGGGGGDGDGAPLPATVSTSKAELPRQHSPSPTDTSEETKSGVAAGGGAAEESDAVWGASLGWDVPLTHSASADADGWQVPTEGSLPQLEGWEATESAPEISTVHGSPNAIVEAPQVQHGSGSELHTASAAAVAQQLPSPLPLPLPLPLPAADPAVKMWYYVDPSGSTQGPCSITQFHVWLQQLRYDAGMRVEYDQLKDVSVWREGMNVRVPLPTLVGPL